ncbi:MAG: peptidoglycan DD-metalloendopeptidase family protein [Clostridia bacterium]|nr:peptidoglycan DD-metalloendopeptidase family protein [Clostridia bacterium]
MRGKKILKSLYLTILSGSLLFGNFFGPSVINSLQSETKKAELQRKKKELAEQLKKASDEVSKEAKNKDALDKKISIVKNQIDISNDYINSLDNEILSLRDQINEIKERMAQKVVLLRKSLVAIYKAGDTSTLDIILGAKDFEDFLDKVDIARSISKYVKKLIDELKSDLIDIEEKEKEIIKTKSEQEREREGLEKNRAGLQNLFDESEKLLSELQGEEKKAKDRIDQNDAQIKALDAQIKKYYDNLNKKNQQSNYDSEKAPKSKGEFIWPLPGYTKITSDYSDTSERSHMHGAIDIAGAGVYGAKIVASASGKVIFAGSGGGYGKYVVIDHGNGISTLYAHMSSVAVSVGQQVSQGQTIGNVGSTGHSTGPHLHFEYRVNGVRQNPHKIV